MRILKVGVFLLFLVLVGCKEEESPDLGPVVPPTENRDNDSSSLDDGPIDFSAFRDNYADIADPMFADQWAHYNVHDPSVIDDGDFFYCYNTDVAYGYAVRPGLQIRRSINLVEWEFVGWVFSAIPSQGASYIRLNGGEPNNSLWAPYAMKFGNEYRVYYSLASNVGRLSAIGLGVSDDPRGPFTERGVVVRSINDNNAHTNAIDPSIVIDKEGRHWMYYGSSWDGIYRMELDPETGLAKNDGDIGVRVAHRGFTGNTINGNIEGPEMIYNPEFDMYYMFIAYDWLETKYNVRVGRSTSPTGPFVDINGQDVNQFQDDLPMILAPYKFENHPGWQGVSHPAVFAKDGEFYMAHQGRPGQDPFFMILHTRQIHWTEDGWPIVSPERFADEKETVVAESDITGTWEYIYFDYRIVPGFAETQVSPDFQVSQTITLDSQNTVNGDPLSTWSYDSPWLTIIWNDGERTDKVFVERGRDWENEISETLLFTGMDQNYTTVWGKKIE